MLSDLSTSHNNRSVNLNLNTGGERLCAFCGNRAARAHAFHCSDECRFWSKVQKGPGCWLWTASRKRFDRRQVEWYGQFTLDRDGKRVCVGAHQYAWELEHGPIPEGKSVLHRCDTSWCVRHDHLFLGTQGDNMKDAAAKHRLCVSRPALQKLTPEQIYEMRDLRAAGWTFDRLGARYGVTKSQASLVVRGKRRQYDAPLRPELEQVG